METRENARDRILNAALDVFAEHGYAGARVKEIARRAGVSQALIYYNFASKAAMLDAIMSELQSDLVEKFSRIYPTGGARRSGWNTDEIWAGIEFFARSRKIWAILGQQAFAGDEGKKTLLELWDGLNRRIRFDLLDARGFSVGDEDVTRDLVDTFFVFFPALMLSLFSDLWAKDRGYSAEHVKDAYSAIVNDIYKRYLRDQPDE